ncbi:methyltransferase-like protein 27 [Lingula anatina]|uniref:Methyltransferase-like protein 27 n=1 Tax=Lingula anatina TaxID=7574 RepID=A0A1S3JQ39_LINAN|nr:methyltransferase-like protein 27 [Lingula anatina]|eukprot:XP_013412465.1 methyltransferase-like protein 27 [Lingula anatina]
MAEQQVEKSHPVIDQFKRRDITREETAKLYSTWAKDYDKDIADLSYFSPSNDAAELEKLLGEKKDALILDVCCGTGLAGQELSKRGFHNLHGLDASKEMLEQARQKGVYKKLINATVGTNRVDIANDTYDAVIMSGGVGCGHVNAGGLAEMIRLVKPGKIK